MTYSRMNNLALLCLLMITASLGLPSAGMADTLAEHRIKISFDLAEHKIFGTVDATFPESVRAIAVGRGLRITRFVINGKSDAPEMKDNRIALPLHRGTMHIQMEYEGVFSNEKGESLANTIGDEGVFLLSVCILLQRSNSHAFPCKRWFPKAFKPSLKPRIQLLRIWETASS